jgi:SOS-response transcriptional repressor LexA
MRLDLAQRFQRRVPFIALAPKECIRVNVSGLGQSTLRKAGFLESGAKPIDEIGDHAVVESTFWCAAQGHKHATMCLIPPMRWRMARTPDEKREVLRAFIQERKAQGSFNVARWAKDAAVSKNSLYNFLNGHSDALDLLTYQKLARAAGVPLHRLTGDAPDQPAPSAIWVAGHIEAGAFQEAVEWDQSRWYAVDVPVPTRFRSRAKALEVRGPSMNKEYPAGSVVVWVDHLDFRAPKDGDHVIVYAYAHDDTIEATVKELRITDGRQWLWPQSYDPDHQQPVEITNPPEHVSRIEIQGIVLGGYKARVH